MNRMVGVFKGEDGSMGFEKGKTYVLETSIYSQSKLFFGKPFILLKNTRGKEKCYYSSVESILENWDLEMVI